MFTDRDRSAAFTNAFENLESRQMLAADLSAAIASPAAGALLPYGVEHRALITVMNAGTSGTVAATSLKLFASADGTLDASDTLLGSRSISSLRAGESETEDIEFVPPSGLAPGAYTLFAVVDGENAIAESNEANNTSAPLAVTFGGGGGDGGGGGGSVDLTTSIVSPAAGATLAHGVEQRVLISITNGGSGGTGVAPGLKLFASTDGTLDASDTLLGSRAVSPLSAGETEVEDIEFVIPSALAAGSYTLFAVVDGENAIAESDDSNNISSPLAVTFGGGGGGGGGGSGVDLTASVVSPAEGATLAFGVEQRVLITVSNRGSLSTAAASALKLFASTDGTLDASDTLLGSRSISSLSAGESETEDIEFVIPSSLAAGGYSLFAVVDGDNVIVESDDANNTSAPVAVTFSGSGGGGGSGNVDLTASIASPAAGATMAFGAEQRVLVTVANSGGSSTGFAAGLRLFASTDGTLDDSDTLLGTRSISSLSAGESETEDVEFVLPSSLVPGSYTLFAVVDGDNAITETDETNNTSAPVAVTFSGSGGGGGGGGGTTTADLSVTLNQPSAPLVPNREAHMIVNVTNAGNARVRGVAVSIYVMNGDTANPASDTLLGSRTLSTLSGGETESEDIEFRVPAGLAEGTHRLYAIVDPANAVAESDESNNLSPIVEAGFAAASVDLSGSVISSRLSDDLIAGESGKSTVKFSIANSGNQSFAPRDAAVVRAYLRPVGVEDNSQDLAVSEARRESISKLTSGASRSRELKINIPASLSAGEYRLVIVIDDSGNHSEADESNNTVSDDRIIRVAAQTIDLAATAASVSIRGSASAAKSYRGSVTISNLGNSAAKGTASVQFFLRDAEGNEIAVSGASARKLSLKAGKTSSVKVNISAPAGTAAGQYTLVARVTPGAGLTDVSLANNDFIAGPFTLG